MSKKRGPKPGSGGRPKTKNHRDKKVVFYLTEGEKRLLELVAKQKQTTGALYAREVTLREIQS